MKVFLVQLYQITTALMEGFRDEGILYANRPFLLILTFITNGMIIHYFDSVWYFWAILVYVNLIFVIGLLSYIGEYIYRSETEENNLDFNFRTTSEGQDFLIILYLGLVLALSGFREAFGAPHLNRPFFLILFYVGNSFIFYYFGEIWFDWILLLIVSLLYMFIVLSYIGEYVYHKNKEVTE